MLIYIPNLPTRMFAIFHMHSFMLGLGIHAKQYYERDYEKFEPQNLNRAKVI